MSRGRALSVAVVLAGLVSAAALAGESVPVEGSKTQFPTTIDRPIGGKSVPMVLTGTALRKKYFVNVYSVGSYLQQGVTAHNADDLVAVDAVKQLHLVMERDVDGKTMAAAFASAVRMNHAAPAFDAEIAQLAGFLEANPVKKGDEVRLTSIPGVGLQGSMGGKTEMVIRNPAFARAIWEIYLGKNNLGESIKNGLVSRL